jgi:membrane protein DedA with SNARE-associated domain
MDASLDWIAQYGYMAIFLLLMLGIVGLPVPDETLLTFAGYLSFKGQLLLEPTLGAAFLGSACGISLSYGLGRLVGLHVVRKLAPTLHLQPDHLSKAQLWFERWGKYTLLIGYFVPGVRHLTALVAGASNLSFTFFAPFAYLGALVWSGCFIVLGYVVGEKWSQRSPELHNVLLIGTALVVLMLAAAMLIAKRQASRR